MEREIAIVERSLGTALEIEERCSVFKLPTMLGQHYGTILAYAEEAGIKTVDMPYARYLDINWKAEARRGIFGMAKQMLFEKMHFAAGRLVEPAATGSDNVRAYDFGSQRYLRAFHVGPYMQIGRTYKRLIAYALDQGLELRDHSVEHYIDDPGKVDKAALRTDVMIPLR